MWLPQFACPECRETLVQDTAGAFLCVSCQQRYERREGIYPVLEPVALGPRRSLCGAVPVGSRDRTAIGKRRRSITGCCRWSRRAIRAPPNGAFAVKATHTFSSARSPVSGRDRFARWISERAAGGSRIGLRPSGTMRWPWIGWTMRSMGSAPVVTIRCPFAVVEADFDALPFEPAQFDVVILNSSLHYSPDPSATLNEAKRMLGPGGSLVVMDSPMFSHAADGHAMVDAQRHAFTAHYGVTDVVRPGVGFLTFRDLERLADELGLRARFFPSRGPMGWRLRRHVARLRLRRRPAAFGVWVAQ